MFASILRWIAASGRPEALTQRDDDGEITVRYAGDNWLARLVSRNRVLTASCIAVSLFTFGGFAWSARQEPRLVRKQVETIPSTDTFDELLDIPVYEGVTEQLQDEAQATANRGQYNTTNDLDFDAPIEQAEQSTPYNPFNDLPEAAFTTPDHEIQNESLNTTTNSFESDSLEDLPDFTPPTQPDTNSPVMPNFGSGPSLDTSGDLAQPLLRTGFTRQRR